MLKPRESRMRLDLQPIKSQYRHPLTEPINTPKKRMLANQEISSVDICKLGMMILDSVTEDPARK